MDPPPDLRGSTKPGTHRNRIRDGSATRTTGKSGTGEEETIPAHWRSSSMDGNVNDLHDMRHDKNSQSSFKSQNRECAPSGLQPDLPEDKGEKAATADTPRPHEGQESTPLAHRYQKKKDGGRRIPLHPSQLAPPTSVSGTQPAASQKQNHTSEEGRSARGIKPARYGVNRAPLRPEALAPSTAYHLAQLASVGNSSGNAPSVDFKPVGDPYSGHKAAQTGSGSGSSADQLGQGGVTTTFGAAMATRSVIPPKKLSRRAPLNVTASPGSRNSRETAAVETTRADGKKPSMDLGNRTKEVANQLRHVLKGRESTVSRAPIAPSATSNSTPGSSPAVDKNQQH